MAEDKGLDLDAREAESQEEKKEGKKELTAEAKKELEKIKQKLDTFKKQILKKFSYLNAVALLPPQASHIIEEEEEIIIGGKNISEMPEEKREKLIHVLIVLPDDKSKEAAKIRVEVIKLVEGMKPKVWVHIKTTSELWEICFDGKYEYIEAIAMSFPLYDKGILGGLRVANIHKSLVLRKFERYVVSYVIAGSLVRGTTVKTSDVDVYIIIDDTDVKRMSRLELREKLRAIIYQYVYEASEIAGVKNKLSPQVYLFTEFWESVKDAHPVIFTFIRDGVPLYDRGAFMPWKLLLKMGKIKPSPEAIDMFMSLGDKVSEEVRNKLKDIATTDIYWGIITPTQAILMLYGIAPPTPRETVELMRKIFVEKEKMLEKRYVDFLHKVVEIYKGSEHEKFKEISGKEIDGLLGGSTDYMKRMKELMKQIEAKAREKTIVQIYHDVFSLLEKIFGRESESRLASLMESELVKKGKLPERALVILKEIAKAKRDYKKHKLTKHEVEAARKDAFELMTWLIEYSQRCDIAEIEKTKLRLRYKVGGKEGKEETHEVDAFVIGNDVYVVMPESIKKVTVGGITTVIKEEFQKAFEERKQGTLNQKLLKQLEKLLPEFEVVF